MKILSEKNIANAFILSPGDTFTMSYTDIDGKYTQLDAIEIDKDMKIDRIVIAEVKDEYGFKTGLCGIIGESQKGN